MRRGSSGYSLVVGIDKEAGHSSHSALAGLKRTLGEGRVGHCGTLDPFATGVLVALAGPATGLARYIESDDKTYLGEIVFGRATNTDDVEGQTVSHAASVPSGWDAFDAQRILNAFIGDSMQVPPAFSALKLAGRRAYEEARKGNAVKLDPRPIHVFDARIIEIGETDDEGRLVPSWKVEFKVSKGTYIRALARDIGKAAGSAAYLGSLRRLVSGNVGIEDCIPEGSMLEVVTDSILDPVALLGYKVAFPGQRVLERVSNGNPVDSSEVSLFSYLGAEVPDDHLCTARTRAYNGPLENGELVSIASPKGLKAIYRYDEPSGRLVADRVFQTEVSRGPYDIS